MTTVADRLPLTGSPRPFRVPPYIVSGPGAVVACGDIGRRLGLGRVLLVTDARLVAASLAVTALDALAGASIEVEVFDGITAEPTTDGVERALERYRSTGCDGVIALGGGSVIDTGKAVSALATHPGRLSDYEGYDRFIRASAALIAVPTTAGTGSEVTRVAVVTDPQRHVKMLLVADELLPAAAVVDPDLTLTCPPDVTASSGLDALTHAIEAFLSRRASPLTDDLACAAAAAIWEALPRAYLDGADRAARGRMMVGQLEAGMAFSNASVALVHGMSRPLGAIFGIPHGIANAMLLPTVLRYTMPEAEDRLATLASVVDASDASAPGERAIEFVDAVERLTRNLGIPTLGRYGLQQREFEEALDKMAADALASGSPANNPRIPTPGEIVALYREAY